jgi:hypothetical protein
MHDDQDTRSAAGRGDALERDILYLITEPDGQPIWSVEDIGREVETNDPTVPPKTLLAGLFVPRERRAPTHFKNGIATGGAA